MLFPDRSVEENIFASVLPTAPLAFVSRRAYRRRVEAALDRLGASIDLGRRVGDLPLAHRQLVEIARALCAGGTVLVLDEPTSALSQPEAQGLFGAIRAIVAHNAAVIFVSHRLDEVFAITDRLTVLRDGRVEGRWRTADADIPTITRAMVGQLADEQPRPADEVKRGSVAIAVRGSAQGLSDLDLSIGRRRGRRPCGARRFRRVDRSADARWHRAGRRPDRGRGTRGRIPPSKPGDR